LISAPFFIARTFYRERARLARNERAGVQIKVLCAFA
jgi:hypothetical protein